MRINCVSCGHKVELDDAYSDYQGLVRCLTCGALLEVEIREGNIKSVKCVARHKETSVGTTA